MQGEPFVTVLETAGGLTASEAFKDSACLM